MLPPTCNLDEPLPGARDDPLEGDDGLRHLLDHVHPPTLQPHHLPRVSVPGQKLHLVISRVQGIVFNVSQNISRSPPLTMRQVSSQCYITGILIKTFSNDDLFYISEIFFFLSSKITSPAIEGGGGLEPMIRPPLIVLNIQKKIPN